MKYLVSDSCTGVQDRLRCSVMEISWCRSDRLMVAFFAWWLVFLFLKMRPARISDISMVGVVAVVFISRPSTILCVIECEAAEVWRVACGAQYTVAGFYVGCIES